MSGKSIAITNVRVFTGTALTEPRTVVINGSHIGVQGSDEDEVDKVDGRSGVLLPGFIDAHIHLAGAESLAAFARCGVTTALDMGTWPPDAVDDLRGGVARTDIRSSGLGATSAGSNHSKIPGRPADGLVAGAADAQRWVAERAAEGADYIKVIADIPGPDQKTLDAIVVAAHDRHLRVVAHAATRPAVQMALQAGVDVVTHAPLDRPLDAADAQRMLTDGTIIVPTLAIMQGTANRIGRPDAYSCARDSVAVLHAAGVPVVAGTDANSAAGVPYSPPFGDSLHQELALLVQAGLTPAEALRAATRSAAEHFGLSDRGVVEPGRRADLVLVSGNPLEDIAATRTIERVWIGGVEMPRG